MEVISFDDPVANTVPSANLISGDYLSSSTDKSETNSLSVIITNNTLKTSNRNTSKLIFKREPRKKFVRLKDQYL